MSRTNQRTLPGMAGMEPRKANITGLPPAARREDREFIEQRELFVFLRAFAHIHPRFDLIGASGNGIYKSQVQAARAKDAGMRRGDWDMFIPGLRSWGNTDTGQIWCGGLFVEMKSGKGTLTKEQAAYRDALQNQYAFVIAYSWLEAARAIVDYLDIIDPKIAAFLTDNARVTLPKDRDTEGTPAT